jgi:hypothetical protein
MTNTNNLEGVKCPACGNEETFRIQITTMAEVTDDGAEAEHGDIEWDETSYAECANCYHHGRLLHFKAQGEAPPGSRPPAPTLLDALQQAVAALNTAPRFAVPSFDTDSYRIAALCDLAIAKAKGGAQ